jgi:DNA (cytosine-5)-methyltransferase 1
MDMDEVRVLNLYAGLGGNRKLWQNCHVTAVEIDQKLADVYQEQHPNDEVVVADAHEYLRKNYHKFDFIWSSPPCVSHSQLAIATRHENKKYPDMSLYQEIIFLQAHFKGKWLVENVVPHYEPLISPTNRVGRHIFWANFKFYVSHMPNPGNFINGTNTEASEILKNWLDIRYEGNIYHKGNHCPAQVLRNCVHPLMGLKIFEQAFEADEEQGELFT